MHDESKKLTLTPNGMYNRDLAYAACGHTVTGRYHIPCSHGGECVRQHSGACGKVVFSIISPQQPSNSADIEGQLG